MKLVCRLLFISLLATLFGSFCCIAQNIDTLQRDYLKFDERHNISILKGKITGLSDSMRREIQDVDVRIQSFDIEDEYRRSYPINSDGSFEVTLDYYVPFQELFVEIGDYSSAIFVFDSAGVIFDFTEHNENEEPKVQFTRNHANESKFLYAYTHALAEYKKHDDHFSTIERLIDEGVDSVVFLDAISSGKEKLLHFTEQYLEANVAPSDLEQIVKQSNEAMILSSVLHYYWTTDQVMPPQLEQRITGFQPKLLLSTVNRFYYYLSSYLRSSWERDRGTPSVELLIDERLAAGNLTDQAVDQLKHTKILYKQYLQDKDTEFYTDYIDELDRNFQIINHEYKDFLQQRIAQWAKENHQTLWDYLSGKFPNPIGDILIAKSSPRKEQLTGDSLVNEYNEILPYVKSPLVSYFMKSYVKSIQTSLAQNNAPSRTVLPIRDQTDRKLIQVDFDEYAELYHNESLGGNEIFDHLLEKYKGKVMFIDFWATWCIPCYEDFEKASMLKKNLDLSNMVFIYLCNDSEKDEWMGRIQEKQLEGIHLYMTKAQRRELFKRFHLQGYPSYLLVDKSGKIEFNARWVLEDLDKGSEFINQKTIEPESAN